MKRKKLILATILLLTVFFLGEPCQDTFPALGLDPMTGKIINQQNNSVPGVKILSALMDSGTYKQRLDSTFSNVDGWYFLQKGFPNNYSAHPTVVGCSEDRPPIDQGMRPFMIVLVHESYDTTVAVFQLPGMIAYNPQKTLFQRIDTVFSGKGELYGNPGSTRNGPTIVLKSKKQ